KNHERQGNTGLFLAKEFRLHQDRGLHLFQAGRWKASPSLLSKTFSKLMGRLFRHFHNISGSRFLFLTVCYAVLLAFVLWFSYQVRFDFAVPAGLKETMPEVILWVVLLKLALLFVFGQYSGLLS